MHCSTLYIMRNSNYFLIPKESERSNNAISNLFAMPDHHLQHDSSWSSSSFPSFLRLPAQSNDTSRNQLLDLHADLRVLHVIL